MATVSYNYLTPKKDNSSLSLSNPISSFSLTSSAGQPFSLMSAMDVKQKEIDLGDMELSLKKHAKNVGAQTEEAAKYYKKANMANKIAGYTNLAQGAFDLMNTYNARESVRLTNKQLDMQKDLIDLNIKNSEAILSAQFKNAIADLHAVYAAKNVDISSQALRSQIVGSGEEMGKDMADTRTQGKLQKMAIDFQKTMNNINQRRSEQQAWINFGANAISSAMFLI